MSSVLCRALRRHLANERLLAVIRDLLGPQVRISQTEYKIRPPHYELVRAYHSDFPYDLNQKWHIPQPFPSAVLGITTLWMLSEFTTENGGTWVVPKTHIDLRNPRGKAGRHRRQKPACWRSAGYRQCWQCARHGQPNLAF